MDVFSDFTIPVVGHHVTMYTKLQPENLTGRQVGAAGSMIKWVFMKEDESIV
jgi:hypothetical protein